MNESNPFTHDSLDGQIWESLYYYPMMYRHGGQVLHHMYCVSGNGYEWDGGKLMHDDYIAKDREDIYEEVIDHEYGIELTTQFEIDRLRQNHAIDFVRTHAEMLVKDWHREWKYLYPISECSGLVNVPDDVCEDFCDGARLAIDLSYGALFKGGGLVSFHTGIDNIERRHDATKSSIQVLDESLSGIIDRFGPNPLGVEKTGHRLWCSFHEYVDFQRKFNKRIRESLLSI